jgi:hypothetical protein
MPLFNVEITASVEVAASFVIEAADEADACRLADLMADRVAVTWSVGEAPCPALEWREIDQTAHVDAVEEV